MKKIITVVLLVGLVLGVGIPTLLTAPTNSTPQSTPQPKTGAILYIFGLKPAVGAKNKRQKAQP